MDFSHEFSVDLYLTQLCAGKPSQLHNKRNSLKNFHENYKEILCGLPDVTVFQSFLLVWTSANKTNYVFTSNIDLALKTTTRYSISILNVLVLNEHQKFCHANALLFDNEFKIVERFEPHGLMESNMLYNMKHCDKFLHDYFATEEKYVYLYSYNILPQRGPQSYDLRTKDRVGLCLMWSVSYLILRVTFSQLDSERVAFYLTEWSRKTQKQYKSVRLLQSLALITTHTELSLINHVN
jgi:hypothetical protein